MNTASQKIAAALGEFDLSGVNVSVTDQAYDAALIELRDLRDGSLIWRQYSFETGFFDSLNFELSRYLKPLVVLPVVVVEDLEAPAACRFQLMEVQTDGYKKLLFAAATSDELVDIIEHAARVEFSITMPEQGRYTDAVTAKYGYRLEEGQEWFLSLPVPSQVEAIDRCHSDALTEDATKPKHFTHSFFGNSAAEVVPAHTLIADAVIVTAQRSHGGNYTPEYNQAVADGFVFADWLRVGSHTMLMIKPAGVIKRYMREAIGRGYGIESFQMKIRRGCDATLARAVLSAREHGGIHFQIDAVAGDVELRDLFDRLIDLLAQHPSDNGAAHYEMIRQLTNQPK
jgi:hypothetical protein